VSGPDLSNRSIGSIVLHERLGEGGMGTVYRGFDDRLDRDVAVKVLRADQRSRPASAARFRREARLLSRLEHPGICRVYDLLQVDGHDALVMELVRGETLRDRLRAPMDRSRAVEIAIAIASGLEAAHSMSVVHRDLKPENIMITEGGDVRVLDFGIARSLGEVDIEADGDVVADGGHGRTGPGGDDPDGGRTRYAAVHEPGAGAGASR
jgi:serine/threonine protein kinase